MLPGGSPELAFALIIRIMHAASSPTMMLNEIAGSWNTYCMRRGDVLSVDCASLLSLGRIYWIVYTLRTGHNRAALGEP